MFKQRDRDRPESWTEFRGGVGQLPGAQGLHVRPSGASYPLGLSFPTWYYRETGKGALAKAIERGGEFAQFIEHELDPELTEQAKKKYRVETKLTGQVGKTDIEFIGYRDLAVYDEGKKTTVDFKMWGRKWNEAAMEQEWRKHLDQISYYHYADPGDKLAITYADPATKEAVEKAFRNNEITADQALEELATDGRKWVTPHMRDAAPGIKRVKTFSTDQPVGKQELEDYSVVTQRFQHAVKQMIGITGYQLTSKLRHDLGPTPELVPFYRDSLKVIDEIAYRFATGNMDEGDVQKSFDRVVQNAKAAGYSNVRGNLRNANTVIKEAWVKHDQVALEQQEVKGFTRLRGKGWEPLDDVDPDYSNVLVNRQLGRIAVTHPTSGGGRPSVFWEGTYNEVVDPDGNPIQIINGRALVKQQAVGTRDRPSVEFVMPDVFRNTQRTIKTTGGGDKAARELTALMTGNLSGLPPLQPGSGATSALMAVRTTMMTTQGGYSVQAQQEALGQDMVLRGGSRQARSLSTLIRGTLGWAVDRATGMAFAGLKKGKEGKLGKRAQQSQRDEIIRSDDPSNIRFYPFIQPGTEQYGPEMGERFQIAMPFRPFMPEGIGHVSEKVAGQHRWKEIQRSVDVEGNVDLLPSSGHVYNTRKGLRLGVLQGDVNREIFDPNLEKWSVLEMLDEPGVTRMGSKTRITYRAKVGTRIGSGQGKLWGPGIKAMLAVARMAAMARGDAGLADMILPTPKNMRQFAASVVGHEYARPGGEEELFTQIYGEKAEKTSENWYNLTEAQRERYTEEGYEPEDVPTGMPYMPTDIRDQVRFFGTAARLIAKGIEGHGREKYVQPLSKRRYELFRRAGMPMRTLNSDTLEQDDEARLPGGGRLVEIESPGFLGGFLGQIGREYQGQARLSLEESTSMHASLGYGEDYRKAVREKIMPHAAKLSGHTRRMYLQVSKANMFNEAALRPKEGEYIDLSEIVSGNDAVTGWKDTGDFLRQLAEKTGDRFIRVGDKYYPSGEAFSTMHVPEAWRVMVPYGDEEDEERENVPEQDITRVINALEGVVVSGADSPKLDVLHQALYNKKTGLAYTRAVAKGMTSMLLPHGGVENVALSYSGLPDNVAVMGPATLQDKFGTSDYGLVTEWLNEGNRYAAAIRRPDYMGKEPSPLIVVTPQEAREKLGVLHMSDQFGGVAISPTFMAMQTGDLDGDRIMTLLLATSKQGKQGRKWETDPSVKRAASEQALLGKWATMLSAQLNTTPEELGIDPTNVTMDDWFTLHEMMGPDLSEVQKRLKDTKDAEQAISAAEKSPLGLLSFLFPGGLDPEEGQIFSKSPLAEVRRKYFEEPLAKQHLQFSFNQFRRQMPEYMSQAGITGFDRTADIMKFRAPQHAVDVRMLSRGLVEMLNLSAGYDPATVAKENYKKTLWRPGYRRDPERLSLVGRGNNFQERLVQSVLDSREFWSVGAKEDEALFKTETVANDIARSITANEEMQSTIAEHLMTSESVSGASIYGLFGGDDDERLRNFWRTPGAPVGTVGANVFGKGLRTAGSASRTLAAGKLSAGQMKQLGLRSSDTEEIAQHMSNLANVQSRWTQLENIPEIKKLAGMSGALTAAVAVPSGRGGRWLLENLARFGGVPGTKQIMSLLWGREFSPEETETVMPGIRSYAESGQPDTTLATLNDDEVRLLDTLKATKTPSRELTDIVESGRSGSSLRFEAMLEEYEGMPPERQAAERERMAYFDANKDLYGAARSGGARGLTAALKRRGVPSYQELTEEELSGLFKAPSRPATGQPATTAPAQQEAGYEQNVGILFAAAQELLRRRKEEPRFAREMTPETIEKFAQLGVTVDPGVRTHGQAMEAVEQRYRAGELKPAHMLAGVLRGVPLRSLEPFAGAAGVSKTAMGEWGTMQREGRETSTIMDIALGEQVQDLTGRFESLIGETDPLIGQMKEMREVYQDLGEAAKTATGEQRGQIAQQQKSIEGFFSAAATLAGKAEKGKDFLLQPPGAVGERLGRGMAGLREGLGMGGEGEPPGRMARFGKWAKGGLPSGRSIFAGDLGQLSYGLFNIQRLWRYTGGQVAKLGGEYAQFAGQQQQAMATLGMGADLGTGPMADVMAGQAAMSRARLGLGKSAWDVWGGIPRAVGKYDATMGGGGGQRALMAGIPLGGLALGSALGANVMGRLAGQGGAGAGFLGAAGGLLGKVATPLAYAGIAASVWQGAAGYARGTDPERFPTNRAVLAGGAAALGRGAVGLPIGLVARGLQALGLDNAAESVANLATTAEEGAQAIEEWGGVGGAGEALSPQQKQFQDNIENLSRSAGVSADAALQAITMYGQYTGRTELTGEDMERLEGFARLAPGVQQRTAQTAAGIAGLRGAAYGTEEYAQAMVESLGMAPQERYRMERAAGVIQPVQERLGRMGLEKLNVPVETMTQEQVYDLGQRETARVGMIEQLAGMGAGVGAAERAVGALGGLGGIRGFRGLMGGGDQWAVSRMAGGTREAANLRASYQSAIEELLPGDTGRKLSGMLDDLRPLIDTQTGLRVGVASFPGFSEQLAEGIASGMVSLPEGGVEPWVQQIIEEGGTRDLQVEQTGIQRDYQGWQQQQQGRALDWQRVSQFGGQFEGFGTRGTFAIQKELRNLGRLWADFTTDFQEQQRQVQYSQFMENWQVKAERTPTQFQWQREDLAFKGAQQTMQYGWGQEDIEEALRYATGRERRKLLKQQERATIQYGMGMGQLGVQGERLDVREQWSQEDLEREKRHFLERFALQDEYQSKYRWYMEQRRALEDELQAIQEFGAQFSLEQAEAALAKQIEIQAKLNAISDGFLAVGTTMENIVALAQLFANSSQDALADQIAAAQAQSRAAREAADSYNAMIQTTRQREF